MDVEVPGGVETTTSAQINIYTARGTLIESEGMLLMSYISVEAVPMPRPRSNHSSSFELIY